MNEPITLSLHGKVTLVTGASRGIGRAIALELARNGAKVLVNYNKSPDQALEVVAKIEALLPGSALAVQADVADFEQAHNLVKTCIDQLGGLDILVNNAGIIRDNLILMLKEEDWNQVIDTNLKSTFNCSKAAIRHMIRKRYGRIINIASVAGVMGNPGQTNYSASKAGQIGFTKALAREVASRNITVNAIAPGFVDTEILSHISSETMEQIDKMVPLGRKGKPEEVAYAAAFLASDQASYITGHVLVVDGGMAM